MGTILRISVRSFSAARSRLNLTSRHLLHLLDRFVNRFSKILQWLIQLSGLLTTLLDNE
jgi:hypothetical protein